jgi:hypothetical protein
MMNAKHPVQRVGPSWWLLKSIHRLHILGFELKLSTGDVDCPAKQWDLFMGSFQKQAQVYGAGAEWGGSEDI